MTSLKCSSTVAKCILRTKITCEPWAMRTDQRGSCPAQEQRWRTGCPAARPVHTPGDRWHFITTKLSPVYNWYVCHHMYGWEMIMITNMINSKQGHSILPPNSILASVGLTFDLELWNPAPVTLTLHLWPWASKTLSSDHRPCQVWRWLTIRLLLCIKEFWISAPVTLTFNLDLQ